jgi:hypothetical protein
MTTITAGSLSPGALPGRPGIVRPVSEQVLDSQQNWLPKRGDPGCGPQT